MFSGRKEELSINVPIACGGVAVYPGDVIVGDAEAVVVVPAGKALGGQGALILAQRDIIQHLLETARPYLFSTAPAPAMAAALSAALHLLEAQPQHHARLQENIRHFRIRAEAAGLPMLDSQTAIQPLMAGDNERALQWSAQLRDAGFWVSAIRPPTVPQGKSRLRITLTALHTHLPASVSASNDTSIGDARNARSTRISAAVRRSVCIAMSMRY